MTSATHSVRPFRFGLLSAAGDAQQWRADVQRAQDEGYSSIVLTDHLDLSGAHVTRLAWLPAFADALARTSTLRACVMVANQDLRHPAVLAREVTTVDRLSDGRVELGLGAGHVEQEYRWAGIEFDSASTRVARLKEYCAVVRGLTTAGADTFSFAGKHFTIDAMPTSPLPVNGHLPLTVGGALPKVLGIAARVADTVNLNVLRDDGPADEVLAQKVGWVRDAAGDRFPDLELGMSIPLVAAGSGAPAQAVELAAQRDPFAARVASRVPATQAAAAAYTLAGSPDAMVERLLGYRERHCITQFVLPAHAADVMAPVVRRLT